jgi:glycosyltransferase involved in cell wall biosynthesis
LQDNAIFVEPRNPKSLADAIVDLITNDEKRQNLIGKAQRFIRRYTWRAVGEKLEKVYQRFLKMKESD